MGGADAQPRGHELVEVDAGDPTLCGVPEHCRRKYVVAGVVLDRQRAPVADQAVLSGK
jgi:hypothetical protein